jgi:hypothetical protein
MKFKDVLHKLRQQNDQLLAIHYSCQNLSDDNEDLSPRVTSIAVLHLSSSSMHSFSIHLIAERKRVSRDEIPDQYDELERVMLTEFYDFVKSHQDHLWIHWQMTNINYGFEALSHRYAVLTGFEPPRILDSKKFNLSSLITSAYGHDCVDHPRMINLMKLNGGVHRDFLSGVDEVAAFKDKEYIKLHKSTMCKVYWFKHIYYLLQDKKVKTARTNLWNRANELVEKPAVKVLAFVAVLYTLFQLLQAAYVGFPLPTTTSDLSAPLQKDAQQPKPRAK